MRQKLVIGNWKMHGSLAANAALLEAIKAAPATAKLDAKTARTVRPNCNTVVRDRRFMGAPWRKKGCVDSMPES